MRKIFFVGDMRSPFIRSDVDLLKETNEVPFVFDLGEHAHSFKQIPSYGISCLKEFWNIKSADVVWIWFADLPALPIILIAKVLNKPVVMNLGGWEVSAYKEINYGNQLKTIRGAITRWILRNSSHVITQSEAYKKIVMRVEPCAKNVSVVPPWVNSNLYESPLPTKSGVITAICSLSRDGVLKGIPTFNESTRGISDAKVIVNIPHDDLIAELKKAKVFCLLSLTENFPNVVMESLACGCFPIVTDRDGLLEVTGDVGFKVPYGDAISTRNAIVRALSINVSTEEMRNQARKFSRNRKKKSVEEILNLVYLK
jgi:hypothetical protein